MEKESTVQEQGFRNTKQKNQILDVILELGGDHFTAEGLIDLLKERDCNVGRATVYRYLKQLEDVGQLKKYFLSEGMGACYQFLGENSSCNNHCHVLCCRCGAVLHVEDELLQKFAENLEQKSGFVIDEGRTVFYGRCKNCK